MRLVKRQELMTFPSGTLFCELQQEWVFGGLQLKLDTLVNLGENVDFWVHALDWTEAHDTGEAIERLEKMASDSSVSYPLEEAFSRHGLYDDDRFYLVYEQADTDALLSALGLEQEWTDDVAGPDWQRYSRWVSKTTKHPGLKRVAAGLS